MSNNYKPLVSEVDNRLNNLALLISYIRDDVNIGDADTIKHHVDQLVVTAAKLRQSILLDLDKIKKGDIY